MNTLLLHPTDILFFRDGRPMSGSLAGHGAAWPLPTVLNGALHAALWRADLEDVHSHRSGRSSVRPDNAERDRKFGSLVTAGPFPVSPDGNWFFPRPADAQEKGTTAVTLKPSALTGCSNLPDFLKYSAANTRPPTKDKPEAWWSTAAWQNYLNGAAQAQLRPADFKSDTDFVDTEHTIGIGIDPDTGTQDGERFYSAHYLRLRDGWRLGAFAEALDKKHGNPAEKHDLIHKLFPNSGAETPVIIGGQQRLCTVARHSNVEAPLPRGPEISGTRVKWVLLTPAVWPEIGEHKGGWLPSWVDNDGKVQLLDGPGKNAARRHKVAEGKRIQATLVAAITGKPIPVTGWALPHETTGDSGGAKPTHLAVPAGAVYYFEAENEDAANTLTAALNWHGSGDTTAIRNRRSTLFGEKGFGLGVCGMWETITGAPPASAG